MQTLTRPVQLSQEPPAERELVARLLQDDPSAWREFNGRYSRVIHRSIHKVLHRFSAVCTSDDTAEIYASLCLQLLARDKHKLRSYDHDRGTKLGSWLGMLATHAAYDFLRSRRRDPRQDHQSETEQLQSSAPPPDEMCEVRRRAEWVLGLLGEFSDKDREFMTLYFGDGLEPEQVAAEMGISVKTVYSKKHKIRARLEAIVARRQLAA